MQHQTDLIGKTISGVIARPGSNGQDVIMLQFEDGTCFELLSVQAQRVLRRLARRSPADSQLSFFPHDGDPAATRQRPSLAA